ncbi:DNA-processing protein DprA [Mangrovicoccus sp. HB161399]|uniref:DNA-processing protein DprA n=1 Tax=Mangrovicoccus sp. HB161399 TaxID=2720392 RepID=UPI001553EE84|nr:DNA-processing protein DprA [Mangrovicoccus sp. HB161399]
MSKDDTLRIVLALSSLRGIGPATMKKSLGKIRAAMSEPDIFQALAPVIGKKAGEAEWVAGLGEADRVMARCEEVGIVALSMLDPAYPARLLEMRKPPAVLYCRGRAELLERPTLGVIGTRKPTRIGEVAAARIGAHFSSHGVSICNGLADGIDICSMKPEGEIVPGAVAVMAAGLDLIEEKLAPERIVTRATRVLEAGGLLVTDAAPGAREDQYAVIASCGLQAGLSHALLLVQSPVDGGSRFTVAEACDQPRVIAYLVPPTAEASDPVFGANALLATGPDGLQKFAQVKSAKGPTLVPINSRADYASILRLLEPSATSLV